MHISLTLTSPTAERPTRTNITLLYARLAVLEPATFARCPFAGYTVIAVNSVTTAAPPPNNVTVTVVHLNVASVAVKIADAHCNLLDAS